MSLEKVQEYFDSKGIGDRVRVNKTSSATVTLAAEALGTDECRIAKTLGFSDGEDGAILVVMAGDAKVSNKKYKGFFGNKPRMLSADRIFEITGHEVGGVCPFALLNPAEVYLDESMKRFETVFAACGSTNGTIELNLEELMQHSNAISWVDVCTY